ncbi:MAG: glycosyltransferase family 61 protein [Acidocella sp.]|nr:glycosyltransferase family 61 protein [Acidocella sp.]
MKKVAVITDATSAGFFFPAWHRYYGGQFGAASLHVVTYEGMKSLFAGFELGNLWEINAKYDDTLRAGVISDLVGVLLRSYDVVLRCDVDEFLVPDPARARDLRSYVERNDLPYVTAHGIDVVEVEEEAPLDMSESLLDGQRRFGMRAAALSKTALITVPMRWAEGFHGATVPPVFAGLYNLHMKFADIKSRVSWFELMRAGIEPGTNAHRYFSVGDEHLASVHKFLESRPRREEETEAEFEARFLASVRRNEANGIYQGEFFRQDFLIRLDRFLSGGDVLRTYDGAAMADPPPETGLLRTIEPPSVVPHVAPAFVADFSGQGLGLPLFPSLDVHGSNLVRREDVLLFGPNNLVTREGYWSCEARGRKQGFLEFYTAPFYDPVFPGPKPRIRRGPEGMRLDVAHLAEQDVTVIDESVFLATPLEPAIWGRWITCVTAKIMAYKAYGEGRKFMCHVAQDWEKAFLRLWGVPEAAILPHDPGRTYLLRDVMTVEVSEADLRVSAAERGGFFEMVAKQWDSTPRPGKIFVSRLSRARKYPDYRVLRNEAELAVMLEAMGFVVFEPELSPLETQIAAFAAAEQVVFMGGSGIFNAAFCAPDARVVTIESSARYAGSHAAFFSSLGLRHGVIFGREDESDPAEHKRWDLDLVRTREALAAFFAGA